MTGLPQLERSQITPNLYVGGQYATYGLTKLKKLGVTGIVSMRQRPIQELPSIQFFNTLHLPTPDLHAPTLEQLKQGVSFIENEIEDGGKVYIHCHLGEGRGPTLAIAFLMSTGMLFDEALNSVKQVRPFIRPTKVQIERLHEFEEDLQKSSARNFV